MHAFDRFAYDGAAFDVDEDTSGHIPRNARATLAVPLRPTAALSVPERPTATITVPDRPEAEIET